MKTFLFILCGTWWAAGARATDYVITWTNESGLFSASMAAVPDVLTVTPAPLTYFYHVAAMGFGVGLAAAFAVMSVSHGAYAARRTFEESS